jgi:hypothetical protein
MKKIIRGIVLDKYNNNYQWVQSIYNLKQPIIKMMKINKTNKKISLIEKYYVDLKQNLIINKNMEMLWLLYIQKTNKKRMKNNKNQKQALKNQNKYKIKVIFK